MAPRGFGAKTQKKRTPPATIDMKKHGFLTPDISQCFCDLGGAAAAGSGSQIQQFFSDAVVSDGCVAFQ